MTGWIDLVVHTDEGAWIIDHKSDRVDDGRETFGSYLPRLWAYADALQKLGINVLGVGVDRIRRGEVVLTGVLAGWMCHQDRNVFSKT